MEEKYYIEAFRRCAIATLNAVENKKASFEELASDLIGDKLQLRYEFRSLLAKTAMDTYRRVLKTEKEKFEESQDFKNALELYNQGKFSTLQKAIDFIVL